MSHRQHDTIASPGAWLATVATRVCLDLLRSARVRRERYVGAWLPEPLPAQSTWVDRHPDTTATNPADPADQVTLDESVSMAFLVVLASMTSAQRVALIPHGVFGYPFADIARVTGRTSAACRELASAARRRVRGSLPPQAPAAHQARAVRDFEQAWDAQDINALVGLLAPGATFTVDGGGVVAAAPTPSRAAKTSRATSPTWPPARPAA
ncbi:sigma factor-like helix-turn-helix DNA-binding protein [Streptomyces buecherae]|uniref:sigma factor-like helix-turn-helix DNA-binding protein n=1 Tax=Streptomyces buecherae TaxID=2763006 RepID=UPI0037B87736